MNLLKLRYLFGIVVLVLIVSNSGYAQEKEVKGDTQDKKVSVERKSDKTPTQEEIDREAGIIPEERTQDENTLNAEQVKEKYNSEGNPHEVESNTGIDAPYESSSTTEAEVKITPKREGETKFKQVPGEADDVPVE